MIYPNLQSETMVPPSLALFSALLKREGIQVDLFDTTNYDLETGFIEGLDAHGVPVEAQTVKSHSQEQMAHLAARPFKIETKRKTSSAYGDLRRKVESFSPDLLLVTATENMFPMAVNLLHSIKDLNIRTVLGGVFATFAPALCMRWQEFDMLCVGEGEHAIVELCRRIMKGQDYTDVPSLWVRLSDGSIRKNLMSSRVNMDANPLPDFSIFEDSRFRRPMSGEIYRIFPIETHRGCPYTCTFCNSPSQDQLYSAQVGQKFFRKKSFEEIRKELLFCRDEWKAEYFFFWADTFFAWSEQEFDAFCEMYQDIGIPFWCQTRPETVTDRHIRKLKDVGIHKMGFGVEHGNHEYRKRVISRAYTNDLVIDKMKIPGEYGVHFSVNNIIGFPDETRDLVFDTIRLNRQIASDTMSCSIFTPYHGTELRNMAVKRGYIHPDVICPTNSDDSVLHMPSPFLSKEQMRGLRRTFQMYVRFPLERWPEIEKAESMTPAGDEVWSQLREEFVTTFFNQPEGDIEKINT